MNMPPPEMFDAHSRMNSLMSFRRNWTSMLSGTRRDERRSRMFHLEPVTHQQGLAADRLPEPPSRVVPHRGGELELSEVVTREPVARGVHEGPADAAAPRRARDRDLRDEADVGDSVDRRIARHPAEAE